MNVCVAGLTWWTLNRENKKRDRLEAEGQRSAGLKNAGDDDVKWRFTI
jgi:hypothetical protein